jgi:hypothetical protein
MVGRLSASPSPRTCHFARPSETDSIPRHWLRCWSQWTASEPFACRTVIRVTPLEPVQAATPPKFARPRSDSTVRIVPLALRKKY